jgi:hypothetical protein
MCLIRKEGYNFGIVKDNPIEAYKVLIERDGDLISPVRAFRYRMGKTYYEEMLGAIGDYSIDGFPVYEQGFHMLSTIEGANQYLNKIKWFVEWQNDFIKQICNTKCDFLAIVKCVIPPSEYTLYSSGVDSDFGIQGIVSKRIKIVGIVSKTPIESKRNAPNLKSFEL